ncbi:SUMF1/EgtB/PvdO family nonheme iron enzyme, partial [bacterium]|nr:SUMF1/EgtB/PvdO family nonheme iron enzyme [bacterium]
MLVDFDDVFIDYAIRNGFVTAPQVDECRSLQKKEGEQGKRSYLGQILIKKRFLTCSAFLEIENALGQKLYECTECRARYAGSELRESGSLDCRCGAQVRAEGAGLSMVEILASHDPRDLTISLVPRASAPPPLSPAAPPKEGSARWGSSGIGKPLPDLGSGRWRLPPEPHKEGSSRWGAPPLPAKEGSARWGAGAARTSEPAKPQEPSRPEAREAPPDGPRTTSKLNRAVLELSREELVGLQRFLVLEEIGRGGMGLVFKARQIDMDRVCALKVIKASPNVPEVQINRFVQEARAAAQLNHPNIVAIYDFGRYRDMFWIAMEFIEGTSLTRAIYEEKVPIDRAVELAQDVLDAIAYAHSKGVIHRDLKPQNILIEKERGRGKLIDFGLAKDNTVELGLTQEGQILGSPYYLSPEQTRGESRNVDGRSDIFAMGTLLYEMLTRTRPFSGKSAAEVYAKILKERPVPLISIEPEIGGALQEVVLKALEKEPASRYQTAEEMRAALAAWLEEKRARPAGTGPPSGRAKLATQKIARVATTGSGRLHDPKRTSRSIAVATAPEEASSGSGRIVGVLVAAFVAFGLIVLVASQSHTSKEATGPGSSDRKPETDVPATSVPSTRETRPPDDTSAPPREETVAIRELEAFERSSPTDWGELLARWKEIADRYPAHAVRAREKLALTREKAKDELEQLLARADALSLDMKFGDASQLLDQAFPRFERTEWTERVRARSKKAEEDACAAARAACAASEKLLASRDFLGAMAAVTSFTKTGIDEADKILRDQRAKIHEEQVKADDAQAQALARKREEREQKIAEADALAKKRRFQEALAITEALLRDELPQETRASLALTNEVLSLERNVLDGAKRANLAAARASERDLEVEVSKNVTGTIVRLSGTIAFVRVPSAGGLAECEIASLAPRTVARLFELSPEGATKEAVLARAVFFLKEGEADLARNAFEDAKKKGAPVSAFEALFAALGDAPKGEKPPPGTGPTPPVVTPPRPGTHAPQERAVSKDGDMVLIAASEFTMGVPSPVETPYLDQTPDRKVTLDAFSIDRYEVTNNQYGKFLEWIAKNKEQAHRYCSPREQKDKDHTPAEWDSPRFGGAAHPVVGVDWFDAYAFSRWARKRLPTEAEWERTARGTDARPYPWGKSWEPKKCVSPAHWLKSPVLDDALWQKF